MSVHTRQILTEVWNLLLSTKFEHVLLLTEIKSWLLVHCFHLHKDVNSAGRVPTGNHVNTGMTLDNGADGAQSFPSQTLNRSAFTREDINLSGLGHGANHEHVIAVRMPFCFERTQPSSGLSVVIDAFEGLHVLFVNLGAAVVGMVEPDLVVIRNSRYSSARDLAEKGRT